MGVAGLLFVALAGCPGDADRPVLVDQGAADSGLVVNPDGGGAAPDRGAPDGTTAPACSATGVASDCDPLANSGCGDGDCYVLKDEGAACLCPSGAVPSGQDCSSSTECVPGHACAGTAPPGRCRPLCDPASPACPDATPGCVPIPGHEQFGICKPPE